MYTKPNNELYSRICVQENIFITENIMNVFNNIINILSKHKLARLKKERNLLKLDIFEIAMEEDVRLFNKAKKFDILLKTQENPHVSSDQFTIGNDLV